MRHLPMVMVKTIGRETLAQMRSNISQVLDSQGIPT